jgi:hypothetical protein
MTHIPTRNEYSQLQAKSLKKAKTFPPRNAEGTELRRKKILGDTRRFRRSSADKLFLFGCGRWVAALACLEHWQGRRVRVGNIAIVDLFQMAL